MMGARETRKTEIDGSLGVDDGNVSTDEDQKCAAETRLLGVFDPIVGPCLLRARDPFC